MCEKCGIIGCSCARDTFLSGLYQTPKIDITTPKVDFNLHLEEKRRIDRDYGLQHIAPKPPPLGSRMPPGF